MVDELWWARETRKRRQLASGISPNFRLCSVRCLMTFFPEFLSLRTLDLELDFLLCSSGTNVRRSFPISVLVRKLAKGFKSVLGVCINRAQYNCIIEKRTIILAFVNFAFRSYSEAAASATGHMEDPGGRHPESMKQPVRAGNVNIEFLMEMSIEMLLSADAWTASTCVRFCVIAKQTANNSLGAACYGAYTGATYQHEKEV
jgi:hypothetical protein